MNTLSKLFTITAALTFSCLNSAAISAQSQKKTPYWVSLDEAEGRMRTGPSTEFPVKWVYKRQNLPLKVVAIHSDWRKVRDPDGDEGWMHVRLLSPQRTALVIGSGIASLRDTPEATGRIAWRVEPGVVGRVSDCSGIWCRLDVQGRAGYIEAERLWGDEAP